MLPLLLLCVLMAAPVQAATFWTDDFENHLTPNWDTSNCSVGQQQDGCNPAISTTQAVSGTHSLRGDYTTTDCLHPFPTYTTCGTYYDRSFTPSTDVYFRFNYKTTGYTYDSTTTKHFYLANGSTYPDVVLKHEYGSNEFGMEIEGDGNACPPTNAPYDSCMYWANMASKPTLNDQWYCIEGHVKYNTPGSSDGVLELWVDGYPTMSRTGLAMRGPNASNGGINNSNTATMSYLRTYVQWGEGLMYYDDLAVGNTRIGCSGSPPATSDTIPPSQVTGASANAASSSSILLTHSGATDAVGVTGYDYARCQGAACTNFTVVSTNNALSYTDTGLTASTLYRYRITAKDAAGNLGTASSIVEATTSSSANTTRRTLYSDTLARADAANLGANWTVEGAAQAIKIVSQTALATTLAVDAIEYYSAGTLPADQWGQLTVATVAGASAKEAAIKLRDDGTGNNAYWIRATIDEGAQTTRISKSVAGVFTTLNMTVGDVWVSGDVLLGTVVGSTICAYKNTVVVVCVHDTSLASGSYGGVYLYTEGALTDNRVNAITFGDYTATTAPTITAATVDTTGASLTFGATTPTSVRVQVVGTTISDTVVTTATTAGGRIQVGSDAFTRADAADLGTNWTPITNTWTIASNTAQASAVNAAMVESETTGLQDNQYAQATLSAFGGSVDIYGGVKTRAIHQGDTGYMCLAARGTSAGTSLERRNSGTATYLATESASVWIPGDVIRLESDGITHRCYKNGVKILEATDSNITTGFAGIWGYIAVGGTATDLRLDSFSSGNLTPLDTTGRYTMTWPQGSQSVTFIPRDSEGAENTANGAYQTVSLSGVVAADTTAPVISGGAPTSVLAAGTTSITESVATNEPAQCKRSSTDTTYALMSNTMTTANGLTHTWTATGLANNTSYTIYVRCTDQYPDSSVLHNNSNDTSYSFTYSVAAAGGDTTAPSTVTGVTATAVSSSQVNVTFTAATDNTAVTGYKGYLCSDSVCTTSQIINPTWSTATTQSIQGLSPSAQYYIAVKAFDAAGNHSAAFSNVVGVTTLSTVDVSPPSILSNLHVEGTYKNSVILVWNAGTDDQGPASAIIEQSPAGCTSWSTVVSQLTQTKLIVSLQPSATYCFRGKFSDQSGNVSTAWSDTLQVTTGSTGLPRPRLTTVIPRTPRS